MLPGGDLYAREKAFLDMAAARTERDLDVWLQALRCPILRADGTLPIGQNAAHLCTDAAGYARPALSARRMHGREKGACIPASPFHRMLSTDASAFISAPSAAERQKRRSPRKRDRRFISASAHGNAVFGQIIA